MDFNVTIQNFANNFLLKSYSERFIHEVEKKTYRVSTRICHHLDEIFPAKYLLPHRYSINDVNFQNDLDGYLFLREFESITWCGAKREITRVGGGGWLFISTVGDKFYAESEGAPPKMVYSGIT